jgi:uncharacterized protein YdiU (UPF0061 family)
MWHYSDSGTASTILIGYHHKAIALAHPKSDDDAANGTRYITFAAEVIERTARLYAQWQGVGFVHGVLNTDNNSILGASRLLHVLMY